MERRWKTNLFALTVLLSLAVAAAPFFADIAEFKIVAIIALAWFLIVLAAFRLFGRSALWLLLGLPVIGFARLVSFVFGPRHPPPIVASAFTAADHEDPDRESTKIASIFANDFPVGSDEKKLVATLLQQGFQYPSQPSKNCLPPGQPLPKVAPREGVEICPTEDFRRMLMVGWGDFACGWILWVRWAADKRGKITTVSTGHYYVCL